ncbi:hypothetical protein EDD85DRAFT_793342 [Armillaria nabsnona]|nr:hypothetical protein EDD85DRAFT_793342 [Armillaria nabsnona]
MFVTLEAEEASSSDEDILAEELEGKIVLLDRITVLQTSTMILMAACPPSRLKHILSVEISTMNNTKNGSKASLTDVGHQQREIHHFFMHNQNIEVFYQRIGIYGGLNVWEVSEGREKADQDNAKTMGAKEMQQIRALIALKDDLLHAGTRNGFWCLLHEYVDSAPRFLTPWSPDTVCVCGGQWWSHASYHNDSDRPPQSEKATTSALAHPGTSNSDGPKSRSLQAAPPPGSATASILHSLPPPITAFSGIRTPKVEKAKDLRNISQMSSLPQNKNKKASSLNPDKTGAMKLNVFLYPLCGDTQVDVGPMGPQTLSVRADQLSTVYETVFRRRALAFGLNIPSKSLPLILLYQALKESAATGNYAVPGLEKFDASHPDLAKIQYDSTFPFTVMEHQVRDGRYKFKPDGRLCPGNFTGEALQKLCKKLQSLEGKKYMVLGPAAWMCWPSPTSLMGFWQ